MRHLALIAVLLVSLPSATAGQELRLPNKEGSVKFAIIGDSGEPSAGQRAVAQQMAAWRGRFPFEFTLMTGDNLYGSERPRDYETKFSIPYKALIDGGVKFYASLGNHDDAGQIQYKLFNMDGKKYYSFKPKDGVRFFAILALERITGTRLGYDYAAPAPRRNAAGPLTEGSGDSKERASRDPTGGPRWRNW